MLGSYPKTSTLVENRNFVFSEKYSQKSFPETCDKDTTFVFDQMY